MAKHKKEELYEMFKQIDEYMGEFKKQMLETKLVIDDDIFDEFIFKLAFRKLKKADPVKYDLFCKYQRAVSALT